MKIVFLDAKTVGDDISLERFKKFGDFETYDTTNFKDETIKRVKDANILITNKVVIDKDVMDNAHKLELICVAATGMNNIDLDYAKEKGIIVKNVAGYSTSSVAQHTFTLLLYLMEKVKFYDELVKSKKWSQSTIFTNLDRPYREINGKVWGIIGLGTIGKEVAKIASCFGAKVIYYSTSGKNNSLNYEKATLDDLLKQSHIISIHAPLNSKTKNLIGAKELGLIKKGGIILNLGRGSIINEEDLAKAIDKRDIYAGLDVFENEPIKQDSPLLKIEQKDRVALTPHIAWASVEARERLVKKIEENISQYLGEKNGKRA